VTRAMMMNAKDNVATALEKLEGGVPATVVLPSQEVFREVTPDRGIPAGHKLAVKGINKGDHVVKYGYVIGTATGNIRLGDHVHVHNVMSNRMHMPEVWYREED
jgi:altronate dehydratase small subunit